jgi:type VI secretion system secreted protein VgrG
LSDNYPAAFDFAMTHEVNGKHTYVDDPRDPGGPTAFGITLATLQDCARRYGLVHDGFNLDIDHEGHIDVRDIRAIDRPFAEAFYKEFVWLPQCLDKVLDGKVAAKLLDESINLGPTGMGRIVGNALVANGIRNASPGPIGASTVAEINKADPARFLTWLKRALVVNYERIVEARPASQEFLKGWIARANA